MGSCQTLGHAELYTSHGYEAVRQRFHSSDSQRLWGNSNVGWRYPCNLSVLQRAQGVIVHSKYSLRLAEEWYSGGMRCQLRSFTFCAPQGGHPEQGRRPPGIGFQRFGFSRLCIRAVGASKTQPTSVAGLAELWLGAGQKLLPPLRR